jgi:hypothetical protein
MDGGDDFDLTFDRFDNPGFDKDTPSSHIKDIGRPLSRGYLLGIWLFELLRTGS